MLATAAIGALWGVLVIRLRLPSFVVTLAGLLGLEGLLLYLVNAYGTGRDHPDHQHRAPRHHQRQPEPGGRLDRRGGRRGRCSGRVHLRSGTGPPAERAGGPAAGHHRC